MSGPDPGGGILLKKFAFGVAVTVIGGLILLLLQPVFAPDHPGTPSAPGESPPTVSPSVPTSPPAGFSDTPGATAPASPTLTPLPRRPAGTALPYYANWSTGLGGWTGTDDWNAVDGKLLSRAQGAVYRPESSVAGVQTRQSPCCGPPATAWCSTQQLLSPVRRCTATGWRFGEIS